MADADDRLDGNRAALEAVLLEDPFAAHLGSEVTGWGGGWARAALRVAPEHTNLAGIVHGGVTFSLGDLVFAVSSNSWGRLAVALTVEVQYLAAVEPGAWLVAESRERHRTKRTGAYLIEVRSPASDIEVRSPTSDIEVDRRSADAATPAAAETDEERLVASLHALVHRTDRWHLGEDAWSASWRSTH